MGSGLAGHAGLRAASAEEDEPGVALEPQHVVLGGGAFVGPELRAQLLEEGSAAGLFEINHYFHNSPDNTTLMGLDILLGATNQAELDAGDYNPNDHSLSRNFCNFMCRRSAIEEEPELDQIGRLTGINVSPLYEMENYTLPEDLDVMLEHADNEAERQEIIEQNSAAVAAMSGNIDRVLTTVESLLTHLATIADLPSRLLPDEYDTLHSTAYFANFAAPKMNAYDNTFGQDLRNMKNFLLYAKSKGSETVFFVYG